ncbi:MAG TPA: hypothetical protein VF486_21315 [Actinomycetes bacterium]
MRIADGGGSIQVAPSALGALARRLHAEAARTEQVAAGGGRADVTTGCPQVDAALAAYAGAWTAQVLALARATGQAARSVAVASAGYLTTDAAAMPGPEGDR